MAQIFDNQIESAQEGRIEVVDLVGDPDRRHWIGFEHAIDPAFVQRVLALEEPREHRRWKQVLRLVEDHQRVFVLAERLLAQLQRLDTRIAVARVAVLVDQRHFESGGVDLLRQPAR